METKEIIEFVEMVTDGFDEWKQMTEKIAELLPKFGPDLYKIIEPMSVGVAKMFEAQFKYYISHGFTRGEAIDLISAYAKGLQSIGKK